MKTVGDKVLPTMSGSGDRNQISTKMHRPIGWRPTGLPSRKWRGNQMPKRKQLHKKPSPSDRKPMTDNLEVSSCSIHEVDEPVPDTTYEVCFECGHVWLTKEEVETVYKDVFPDKGLPDDINFCPMCLHDWMN